MFRIHARSPRVVLLLGVLICTAALMTTSAQTPEFISIDAPHGVWDFTVPSGINDRGQIVGYYGNLSLPGIPVVHGFSFIKGVFRTFDVPNSFQTRPIGINNRGTIVGNYLDRDGYHGFRFDGEAFSPIDVAGAMNTQVMGINDRGDVVGTYNSEHEYGSFVIQGGTLTRISSGATFTFATGINNRGEVVGYYTWGGLDGWHGFRWADGTFSTFGAPVGAALVAVHGINDRGDIVGTYREEIGDFPGRQHGFVLNAGQFIEVAIPGARRTVPHGINNAGWVVGIYESPTWLPGVQHGFAAKFD